MNLSGDKVRRIIFRCAVESQTVLTDVINEISQSLEISKEDSIKEFRSQSWFVIHNPELIIECSNVLYHDVERIDKKEFFRKIEDDQLLVFGSPFYYISYEDPAAGARVGNGL